MILMTYNLQLIVLFIKLTITSLSFFQISPSLDNSLDKTRFGLPGLLLLSYLPWHLLSVLLIFCFCLQQRRCSYLFIYGRWCSNCPAWWDDIISLHTGSCIIRPYYTVVAVSLLEFHIVDWGIPYESRLRPSGAKVRRVWIQKLSRCFRRAESAICICSMTMIVRSSNV